MPKIFRTKLRYTTPFKSIGIFNSSYLDFSKFIFTHPNLFEIYLKFHFSDLKQQNFCWTRALIRLQRAKMVMMLCK